MIKLSVNINKIATLRNSRGHDNPNVLDAAKNIMKFGADGITVHPRPDERHIKYKDVFDLKNFLGDKEFNIEGNCSEDKFVDLVLKNKPTQVTLVPDALGQLTSDHGWDTVTHQEYLQKMVKVFKNENIRVSIFVDPKLEMIEAAKTTGTDRIELYTEAYAKNYLNDKVAAIKDYKIAAELAHKLGLGVNAGHDLDLNNLAYLASEIPIISEVSIGHALISDALYFGLENTVQMYKRQLKTADEFGN